MLKRYLLWLLAAGALGTGGAAFYLLSVFPRVQPASAEAIVASPARLARGTYLAEHVLLCGECHSDRDWSRFSAPAVPPAGAGRAECLATDHPMAGVAAGFPGSLCFPNITADGKTGVGSWTDGELLRALREGVDRDGRALFPIMPFFIFRHLADEDARSVVVWIRSLPAVARDREPKDINFPVNFLIRLTPQPVGGPVPEPDATDTVAYGQYLATIGRCIFCHSPRRGPAAEPVPGLLMTGGNEFRGPFGVRRSSNLTPDPTGLGAMTREEFVARFRRHAAPERVAPDKNTVMAWSAYAGMTDGDLVALYAYLRSVPPVATPPG